MRAMSAASRVREIASKSPMLSFEALSMSTLRLLAKGTTGPEVLIELERANGPLRGQLEAELRAAIRAGRLDPGSRLPASRVLARDLGVSRRLVVEAYEQLRAEGYLEGRAGAG